MAQGVSGTFAASGVRAESKAVSVKRHSAVGLSYLRRHSRSLNRKPRENLFR